MEVVRFARTNPEKTCETRYHRSTYVHSVVLTDTICKCTKCGVWKGVGEFGLRNVNGTVRRQAQCVSCRNS